MKKSTIHLSLPAGSKPPEAHVQVDASGVAYLTTRATAADTSMTVVASMGLAASAAAAAAGASDMTIDFRFLLGESREARARLADVRALTQAIASFRLAIVSRSAGTDAEREARSTRIAAGDAALAAVAPTLAKLETLCGLSSAQLTAEIVRRALAEPSAAAPTAPAPALPPGMTTEDLERALRNSRTSARTNLASWFLGSLAAAALGRGREFDVPRPHEEPKPASLTSPKPPPPTGSVTTSPTPPATPPAVGAVDKIVTTAAATAKPEGAK